jgi:hypothetical protein
MYNSDIPTRAELPSTAKLIKSTILSLIAAAAILVTIVLPAEYAVDPTGIGRMLKLTEMGEIRVQLAAEAEADRLKDEMKQQELRPAPLGEEQSSLLTILVHLIISPAAAQEQIVVAQAAMADELTIALQPTEGVEYKMTMVKDAQVNFTWTVTGGVVNYDMHGTPSGGGKEISYKAERGVANQEGTLTAGFDGTHGWFWRNRGKEPVTITLKVEGAYSDLKRMM